MIKVDVEEKDGLPKVYVGEAIQIGKGEGKLNGIIVENGLHRYSVLCFSKSGIPFLWRERVRKEPYIGFDPIEFGPTPIYNFEYPVLVSEDPQLLVEHLAEKCGHVKKLKSMSIKITEEED